MDSFYNHHRHHLDSLIKLLAYKSIQETIGHNLFATLACYSRLRTNHPDCDSKWLHHEFSSSGPSTKDLIPSSAAFGGLKFMIGQHIFESQWTAAAPRFQPSSSLWSMPWINDNGNKIIMQSSCVVGRSIKRIGLLPKMCFLQYWQFPGTMHRTTRNIGPGDGKVNKIDHVTHRPRICIA